MKEKGYYTAQVCLSGHDTNPAVEGFPEHSKAYCTKCGAPTVTTCESCSAPIRGSLTGVLSTDYSPPSFCHSCGRPYPWTDARLNAAKELSEEIEGLTPEERNILKRSLDDIVRDTPHTTVAATRFKRLAVKSGKATAEGFRNILIDVVSETAKKIIWPGG